MSTNINWSAILLIVATSLCVSSFTAMAQKVPSFGRAGTYGVVAAAGISSTGATVIHGDAGSWPTPTITGFPPGTVADGTLHVAADTPTQGAIADAGTAYSAFVALPCNTSEAAMDIGGTTITPGVHCYSTTLDITGAATLDAQGNSSAVFIFVSGTILTAHTSSSLVLIGGAHPCNVYFIVGSSAVIQTTSIFKANILSAISVSFATGATTTGRVFAGCVSSSGAVSCDTNDLASGATSCPSFVPDPRYSSSSSGPGNDASPVMRPQATVWLLAVAVFLGAMLFN